SRYRRRQERARGRNQGGAAWTCEARTPWSRGVERDRACDGARCPRGDLGPLRTQRGTLEELADLIASHGHVRPVVLAADLSKHRAAESLAVRAVEALSHIDVLINNAAAEGVGSYAAAGDDEDSRELFETNYWSPFALARALLPSMLARGSGALVSVSSLGALPRFRVRGTTLRPRQPSRSRPRRFVPSYVARAYACSSCILASSLLPCSVSSRLVPLSPPG